MQKKGLGKGLGALISSASSAEEPRLEVLPLDMIATNPSQPRKNFDEEKIKELADSIAEHGIVQPVVVKPAGKAYEIVVGERRMRAAKIAGMTSIPAIVRDVKDAEVLEKALIENIQRENLNCIDVANAYKILVEERGISQEDVAKKLGKSRSSVANTLRLLNLPLEAQAALVAGELTEGHARAILSLQGHPAQKTLMERILEEELSVREAEELSREMLSPTEKKEKETKVRESRRATDIEEVLAKRLGAKVKVDIGKRKGKILIEFKKEEELRKIVDSILLGNLR